MDWAFRWTHYGLELVIFFLIDILWLGVLAKGFYDRQLGPLRADQTNWPAAAAFYFIFNLGLTVYAVTPAVMSGEVIQALVRGILYGFFTYSTYDLTNLATLRDWPLTMSLVDILWGVVLCGGTAAITAVLLTL